jgi:hypothetical protein
MFAARQSYLRPGDELGSRMSTSLHYEFISKEIPGVLAKNQLPSLEPLFEIPAENYD